MNEQGLTAAVNAMLSGIKDVEEPIGDKLKRLDRILRLVVHFLSEKENVYFSSYFSRISFLASKYTISGRDIYLFHVFRKLFPLTEEPKKEHLDLGLYILHRVIHTCLGEKLELEMDVKSVDSYFTPAGPNKKETFRYFETVYLHDYHEDLERLVASDSFGRSIQVEIENPDDRKELIRIIGKLQDWNALPIKASLFDIQLREDCLFPAFYVLAPDFLIDVTSISESFDAYGFSISGYGLRKLVDTPASIALHLGNIANTILDELIFDPALKFDHFKKRIFKINPLAFVSFTNEQVRELIRKAEIQYRNILNVINVDFKSLGIEGRSVYIEPSYYAPRIGVQGRFDLLFQENHELHIVELKSGRTFKPNGYGLNNSHYHQTLLYDLILSVNLERSTKRNNFILYSGESEKSLRYAPTLKREQQEAIRVRNFILLEELRMQNGDAEQPYIKFYLEKYNNQLTGFKKRDFDHLKKIYSQLDEIERAYWECSLAFLSREYATSKIGDELSDQNRGLSSIWQCPLDIKRDRFLIVDYLEIKEDLSNTEDALLSLKYSELSTRLSNFRKGDIVVLYPMHALKQDRITAQVFKCSLVDIDDSGVTLRLRSRQMNPRTFTEYKFWNIEHDVLDSSMSRTFRQLYHFAKSENIWRQKLLGRKAPGQFEIQNLSGFPGVTDSQQDIIVKAVSSDDYYLIWGPPGTGKTSAVLRNIIGHYFANTQIRMLVLAYTNRAVDEICETIENIENEIDYIRIGSRYGCDQRFHSKLLNTKLENIQTRKGLKNLLLNHQIYLGTIASIVGKPELFEFLQFGVCIVDESSQVLEPSLVGILSKVRKFILIGDHLQLPAVVRQPVHKAHIKNAQLNSLGIRSLSVSLFERLYYQAITNGWEWSYSQLQEQGRMHSDIMEFVNRHFYSGQLRLLPGLKRLTNDRDWEISSELEQSLRNSRLLFIPSKSEEVHEDLKVNHYESRVVAELIQVIQNIFKSNGYTIDGRTIGVITPFRAQIALVKSALSSVGCNTNNTSIDTVERYQGGSRDIIIISTVVKTPFQLRGIISENLNGIDRKLNVAISRAREQVILIGNKEILGASAYYRAFIESAQLLNWPVNQSR